MTWRLAKCPDTGPIHLQYQTEANPYWTSLWVRNGNLPVDRFEVRSGDGPWSALARGGDGTFTKSDGFGMGAFDVRITGRDGTERTAPFDGFAAGSLVETSLQF
jgi:expansin (peptidoglycan-binding protein)